MDQRDFIQWQTPGHDAGKQFCSGKVVPGPTRVLLFVSGARGDHWQVPIKLALELATGFWGGSEIVPIPIPTSDEERAQALAVARWYSPDMILTYGASAKDYERLLPGTCERLEADIRGRMPEGTTPSAVDDYVERKMDEPLHQEQLGDAFESELGAAAQPFSYDVDKPITRGLDGHSSSFMARVSNIANLPGKVLVAEVTDSLARIVERGCFHPEALNEVNGAGLQVTPGDARNLPTAWQVDSMLERYWPPSSEEIPVIVTGDSPFDFALYYALKRANYGGAYWLQDSSNVGDCIHAVGYGRRAFGGGHDDTIPVISLSRGEADIDADVARLNECGAEYGGTTSYRRITPTGLREFSRGYLYERDAVFRGQHFPINNKTTAAIVLPVPRQLERNLSGGFGWVTSIVLDDWTPLLSRDVVLRSAGATQRWHQSSFRPKDNGIGVLAPGFGIVMSGSVLGNLPVPTVTRLSLIDMLNIRGEGEWVAGQSDKGVFASKTVERFGSLAMLASALRDPERSRLMHDMATGAFGDDNIPFEGLRAYRTSTLNPDDDPARVEALKSLELAGVLQRGVIAKCDTCGKSNWVAMSDNAEQFPCQRCAATVTTSLANLIGDYDPDWFVRLDGAVHEFMHKNGWLSVLAVGDIPLPRGCSYPAAALEVKLNTVEGEPYCEIDVAVQALDQVWLGEATTSDKLAEGNARERSRLEKLKAVAGIVGVKRVVFANSGEWADRTKQNIASIFPAPDYEVLLLENLKLGCHAAAETAVEATV